MVFHFFFFTWHVVRVAAIEQEVAVAVITKWWEDAGNRHAGAAVPPQVACFCFFLSQVGQNNNSTILWIVFFVDDTETRGGLHWFIQLVCVCV